MGNEKVDHTLMAAILVVSIGAEQYGPYLRSARKPSKHRASQQSPARKQPFIQGVRPMKILIVDDNGSPSIEWMLKVKVMR
jgi:hypothetical protein